MLPFSSRKAVPRCAAASYFAALGIPLLRGQTFDANQRLDRATKVIISESFARLYFPGEDPLGKHLLTLGQKSYEIIGVVGDTRFLVAKPPEPMMYFPLYKGIEGGATLAVRGIRDATSSALPIQRLVQQLDAELPVADILTMDQMIGKSTLDASFDAMLVLAFAVLSLVLAAVGLFGVLSYIIAQRTSEIGIRIALGAQRESVLSLVLLDGLRPAFFGLAGSIAATQLIRSMLYGTRPLDPAVFLTVIAILMSVAAAACFIPAWRASRMDPMQALRNE
jgi:putative ABC transport system permease protein